MPIECVDPGIPLSAAEDDKQATKILASVMKRLRRPAPSNRFPHVAEWARGIDLYYGLTTNSEVGPRANHPVGGLDH